MAIGPIRQQPYPCVSACGSSHRSQRGLSIHQATCRHYRHEHNLALESLAIAADELDAMVNPLPILPVLNENLVQAPFVSAPLFNIFLEYSNIQQ